MPRSRSEIVGVHHALHDLLILAKHLGLAQHTVDQGRLAMVDMGDDGDVANVGARLEPAEVFDNRICIALSHKIHLLFCSHMRRRQKPVTTAWSSSSAAHDYTPQVGICAIQMTRKRQQIVCQTSSSASNKPFAFAQKQAKTL